MRKVGFKNLVNTEHIECKRDKGKQHIHCVVHLSKWYAKKDLRQKKKETILLTGKIDRNIWRYMIAKVMNRHGIIKNNP